jgi:hypothetical protein
VLEFHEIVIGEAAPACPRCASSQTVAYRDPSEVATEATDAGSAVALVGADAIGFDGLEEVVRAMVAAGAARIRADVAPGPIAGQAQRLVGLGIRQFRFDLTPAASDPCLVDELRTAVEAVRAAGEEAVARIAVSGSFDVCRHTLQHAPVAVMQAKEAGLSAVVLRVTDASLDLAQATPWLRAACDTGMVNALWVDVEAAPFCFMEGHELHVANVVRPHGGEKPGACDSCALDDVCDGVVEGASEKVLRSISRRADHEALAERVRAVRRGTA